MSALKGQKKALSASSAVLYGFGGLSVTAEVIFLLLFPKLFAEVNTVVLLVCTFVALALSVLVMPLFYALVNGNTSISTGRYHLPFVISGLCAPLTLMLMFSIGGGAVASAFGIVGLVFLHSLAFQIFVYTYFAIGRYFDRSGKAGNMGRLFVFVGVAAAGIAAFLICDGTRADLGACMALGAIVFAAAVTCVYFATVRAMPSFIRLEPKHKRTVKETYKRFISPLGCRAALMYLVATLLVSAAVALFASSVPVMMSDLFDCGFGGYDPLFAVTAFVASVIGGAVVLKVKREKGAVTAFVAVSAVVLALGAACAAIANINLPKGIGTAAGYVIAVAAGACTGLGASVVMASKRTAAMRADCTLGRFTALTQCATFAGVGAGLALCAGVKLLVCGIGAVGAVCAPIAAAVISLAGAVVLLLAYKEKK